MTMYNTPDFIAARIAGMTAKLFDRLPSAETCGSPHSVAFLQLLPAVMMPQAVNRLTEAVQENTSKSRAWRTACTTLIQTKERTEIGRTEMETAA
jgi:hypothetical protein